MAVQRSWFRQRLVLTCAVSVVVISSFSVLSSCGGSDFKSIPPPKNGEPVDPAVVKTIYTAKCGICHGADGTMNYAGAKDLSVSALPRAEVIAQITYGKGTMPPMKSQLTAEQIEALADYVTKLRKQ